MAVKQLGKAASGQTDLTTRADVAAMAVRYDAAQAIAAAQQAQALTNLGLNSTGLESFRNRLINANFAVNQRAYASNTALSSGTYAHDRWKAGASGCTYTFTAGTPDTQITITAGTLLQIVEGGAIEGGTYTLSWTGTATARIYQGSASGVYAASPVRAIGLSAGAAVTVEFGTGTLAQAQLEPGVAASTWERRPPGIELILCGRYFQILYSGYRQYVSDGYPGCNVPFWTPMRAVPTCTYLGDGPVCSGSAFSSFQGGTATAVQAQFNYGTAGTYYNYGFKISASAEL